MKTFISYSHQDETWLNQLKTHISPLVRKGEISIWSDHEILAGQALNSEIKKNMASAELFLLLLSPAYFASDYCMDVELKHALTRYQSKSVKIVPIIVEACNWQSIPELNDLKIIPKDAKPISRWEDHNTAFVEVVGEITRLVSDEFQRSEKLESVNQFTSPILTGMNGAGIEQKNLVDMEPQELLEHLKQGKKKFSGVRIKNLELINYDLTNVDFSGSNLSGAKLGGVNLSGANLSGSNLSNGDLYGSKLLGTNFMYASLINVVFTGSDLSCANFFHANLKNSFLDMAELSGANLISANLDGADLFASNLVCANLWEASLINADLEKCNLDNSNLVYSKLSGANLSSADLKYANLMQANLRKANLENANFNCSNLIQTNLDEAILVNTNLVGTIS